MMQSKTPAHHNNFDLIRLVAAAQVAVIHICEHLNIHLGKFGDVLQLFPGVPIFFFVSGFLVSGSWERSRDLAKYTRNRALRIFPALWMCFAVSVLLAAMFVDIPWTDPQFATWVAAQVSIGQFYNPEFLRGFGVGTLNGSLWTIPVELQFYIVLPVFYLLAAKMGRWLFYALTIGAISVHTVFVTQFAGSDATLVKLFGVSFLPWVGFFLFGVIAQQHWGHLSRFFVGKVLYWLAAYLASAAALSFVPGLIITGNSIGSQSAILLFGVVLSAAYTGPQLARRLLGGNDVSYGLYLYHMPIVNAVITMKLSSSMPVALVAVAAFVASATLALLSWFLIEKPALSLKGKRKNAAADAPVVSLGANPAQSAPVIVGEAGDA